MLNKFKAIFELANIEVSAWYEIKNKYWPDHNDYDCVRTPWYLAKTKSGLIEIGWRKRVIEINWADTGIQANVTEDGVTKELNLVHAWTYAKAVEYMTEWRRQCEQATTKK